MDLLTIGGIAAAFVVVLAACFVIFKLLSRETTFEEAYSDSAIKLLTNQPIAEKSNRKDKPKHKPKRKQSPKDGRQMKHMEEEALTQNVSHSDMPSGAEKSELMESGGKKTEDEGHSKQKKKNEKHKLKMKSKSPSVKAETNGEGAAIEETEKAIPNGKLATEEASGKAFVEEQSETAKVTVGPMEEKAAEAQPTHSAKKAKKNASLKDISMPRVVERLKEIGELEPEYITFLQDLANDVKAKENKLRTEIKELKTEKNEFERNLKSALVEKENLLSEKERITKEKNEQKDRHLIYEQTVRQKLVENVQLKEENKKLLERIEQTNAKITRSDHQFNQQMGLINHELMRAREEYAKQKNYADAVTAESMKTKQEMEEALRKAQMSFEGTLKALRTELNVERDKRMAQDKECHIAKNMMDQLMADVSNSKNQLKDAMVSKSVYDDRIQTLQNELNREKDHHMKVMVNAQKQVGELSQELEKALVAYGNLAQQQSNDSAKCAELTAQIKQKDNELSQMKNDAKSSSELVGLKNSVAELNKCLDERNKMNQNLQNENTQLMENITSKSEQMDLLNKKNQNYVLALDSLKDQLEKVSRVAEETEREKNTHIAQLEQRLTLLEK